MKKHRKAMLRITVAATSLMLAVTAFISLSSNASHSMRHSIVLGHSEIQQALGLSSTPQYYEYMHQEPKPLSLGYSQDGGFPLGYSQNSGLSLGYSQDGDLLVDNSGNHSTDQTYLLTREIYEIADQIHIPHDSAILKSQVLEALEEKILVRFYGGGEDDTICKTCQTIVAMDIKTQELTIVVINADGNQHVVEVSVDGYQMNPLDGDNLETQQWEANMEYSLTDEEIIQYAADDGTYVELIHSGQVDVGNWAPPGITKPDSKPDHELGPESGPNLQSNEYDGVIFDPIPNIEVNNWSRIDTDPEKNQDTHALHTAIILHKHTETLEQTGNTAKLAVPGSGMILSSIPIMPAALLLEQDPDNFYLIRTPEELDAIRNNDLTANYRLDNNIDLTGYVSPTCTLTNGWVGIGRTESQPFRGEFDGNGYTITGLWANDIYLVNNGLFGVIQGEHAKIYDVTVEVSPKGMTSRYALGAVVGYALDDAELRNCRAIIGGELNGEYQVGGIVGKANNGVVIADCETIGGPLTVRGGGYVGGIVGLTNIGVPWDPVAPNMNAKPVTIDHCKVNGEGKLYTTSGNYTGGVVGVAFRTNISSTTAENVQILASLYGGGFAGNIFGRSSVENCHVNGAQIRTRTNYAGGFAGEIHFADTTYPTDYNTVKDCTVTDVQITCGTSITEVCINGGGFAGAIYERSHVRGCRVSNATVVVKNNYGGGFAGVIYADLPIYSHHSLVQDCYVLDSNVKTNEMAGGFAGVIYTNSEIERCGVENTVVEAVQGDGTGGFTGKLFDDAYTSARMSDCYVLNGRVRAGGINIGGLIGQVYYTARLRNSYAQADVVYTGSTGGIVKIGGLIGILYGNAEVINCYATGNISTQRSTAIQGAGSLVGSREGNSAKLQNCFATGTIAVPAGSTLVGGLCGNAGNSAYITNCYFDTTTTRQRNGIGNTNNNPAGVTPLTTTQMIDGSSISFAFQNTASEGGSPDNPWYIDPQITYPYLYYQYNGHNNAGRNYYLGAAKYNNGVSLAKTRADFVIEGPVPFEVRSAGAKWAYFPYTGASMYGIDSSTTVSVPASSFSHDANLYSLGSVSATGIVAFSGMPDVQKTSDRPVWKDGNPDTYTYLNDVVRYELKAGNYSAEYDWHEPVLRDPLPDGVRLVEGSNVMLQYDNGTQSALPLGNPGDTLPYYTYDPGSGVLEIYLETLYSLDSSNTPGSATIWFSARIDREAVTVFNPDGSWEGDNIRNSGTATGELREPDGTVVGPYDIEFDDHNTDPVYDKYTITYNSNYDLDGTRTSNDLEQIKGYYLTDNTEDHTVLHNDNPENGLDYLNFTLTSYDFDGWFYYDSDGTSTIDVVPGDVIESVDRDMVLFARWKPAGFSVNQFTVQKDLVEDDGTPLTPDQKASLPDEPYKETFTIHLTVPDGDAYTGTVLMDGFVSWSPELPGRLPYGEYCITEDTPTYYRFQGVSLAVDGVEQTVSANSLGEYRFTLDAAVVRDKLVEVVVRNTPLGFRAGELSITKTIDGASWDSANPPAAPPFAVTLTGPGSEGPTYTAQVDNNTGVFDFSASNPPLPHILVPGEYILTELDKDGYALNSMTLAMMEDGAMQPSEDITIAGKFQISTDTEQIEIVVDNVTLHPLVFRKVAAEKLDNEYIGLEDAVFELFVCGDPSHTSPGDHGNAGSLAFIGCWEKVNGDITSQANGLIDFGMLKPGHYALLEKVSPDGYATPRGYWVFTLNSSGVVESIAAEGQPPAFVALEKPDSDNATYLVPNFKKTTLPLSGSGAYGLFAGSVLCILVGILLLLRDRRGEY